MVVLSSSGVESVFTCNSGKAPGRLREGARRYLDVDVIVSYHGAA